MTEHLRNGATATEDIERETMRKVIWRILPFLIVSYLVSIIDRGNIGMASLQMNEDLGLSKAAFGFASSLYFVAYFLFEVPSNLAMQKVGARLWIPRIMISWGIVSMCMSLVQNTTSLYIVRFLLGAAEAGFFPGVVLYLTWWIPSRYRARIIASFMVAIPLANFIGSPLSGLILSLDGWVFAAGICCSLLKACRRCCWVLQPGLFSGIALIRRAGLAVNRNNGWKPRWKPSALSKRISDTRPPGSC